MTDQVIISCGRMRPMSTAPEGKMKVGPENDKTRLDFRNKEIGFRYVLPCASGTPLEQINYRGENSTWQWLGGIYGTPYKGKDR